MKLVEKIRKNLVFRAICEFVTRFSIDGVGRASAGLAYFFLLSFFPLLIFTSLLVSTMHINAGFVQEIFEGVIPSDVLGFALNYLEYLRGLNINGLMYTGLFAALWTASRAVNSLSVAVNRAYRIERPRNAFLQFLINIAFSAALLLSIILVIVLMTVGRSVLQYIAQYVQINVTYINIWHVLRFVPVGVMFLVILLVVYALVPNRRIPFRQVFPGAFAAAGGWLIASIGFSFYVENMARYSLLYGSIGAVIVLMVWLYLTGVVLIMGAELNHVLYVLREQKNRERLFDLTQRLPRFSETERARALSEARIDTQEKSERRQERTFDGRE